MARPSPSKVPVHEKYSPGRKSSPSFDEEAPESVPLLLSQRVTQGTSPVLEAGGTDVVQFSSSVYYAGEDDDIVRIEVIRLGTMKGRLAVHCFTGDASAQVDKGNYEGISLQLVFEEGEHTKSIGIKVADTTEGLWSPTLEFRVFLDQPRNCQLGAYLHAADIKIFNNDTFPSGEVEEDVLQGKEAIEGINDWKLFREYCELNFYTGEGINLHTILILIIDQISNIILFVSLWVGVYIVDAIFARGTSSEGLLMKDRYQTACVIALWFVLPNVAMYAWEYAKVRIDINGASASFLQISLMQAYQDYTSESRNQVTPSEFSHAIDESAPEVARGYVAVLDIVRLIGKILTIVVFIMFFQPEPFVICAAFGLVGVLVAAAVVRARLSHYVQERAEEAMSFVNTLTDEAVRKFLVFHGFGKKPVMNAMFEQAVHDATSEKIPVTMTSLNTEYLIKFLSGAFVAVYIVLKTPAVLNNELSLGIFLATISIFTSDLSNAVSELNSQFIKIVDSFVPLKELTFFLNLPTDLQAHQKGSQERRDHTHRERVSLFASSGPQDADAAFKTDLIKIEARDLSFEYIEGEHIFKNVNLSFPQGAIVAVTGNEKSGKTTFMELLSYYLTPTSGSMMVPSHLRILQMAREPTFLRASIISNLCLGLPRGEAVDLDRIYAILKLCQIEEVVSLVRSELEKDGTPRQNTFYNEGIAFDHTSHHHQKLASLAYSQKIKLQLARALVSNPNVLLIPFSLEGLHHNVALDMLEVLREHVNNRGVCVPKSTFNTRRPRSVFFSTSNAELASKADTILRMDPEKNNVVEVKDVNPTPRLGLRPWG